MKIPLLAVVFACCSFAEAPTLIRVIREGVVQSDIYAKAGVNVIGASALSGSSETWLIELHETFASIEDLDKTFNDAGYFGIPGTNGPAWGDGVVPSTNTWIARHRPGLSYRPEQAVQNLAKARYLEVVVYRVAPGSQADFVSAQRLREYSLDTVNSDRPDMAYEVISGAPSGTYISLAPLISLRSMDDGRPTPPVYAAGAAAAARSSARSIDVLRERLWFRMEPRLSLVSQDFAYPDASFWHPPAK